MCAKNYRKWSLFEKVMAKIKRCSFLPHSVYTVLITTVTKCLTTFVKLHCSTWCF